MIYETKNLSSEQLDIGADLLRQGECVAFPTETVYGLGANALDEKAVAKIFIAKGRPADNPLIVHCHEQAQIDALVVDWSGETQVLMDKFWPGPLTLVLPKSSAVPPIVTGGLRSVAIRIPDHPVALALIKAAGIPVAAPSANISGKPSPTRAEHVWQDMRGRIPAIIDGGATGWGLESTVLDCRSLPFRLLRPGGITVEQLREFVPVLVDQGIYQDIDNPPSPGMKYKHYSPEAKVILVMGDNIQTEIQQRIVQYQHQNLKVAVMAFSESKASYFDCYVMDMGPKTNLQIASAGIYHFLREVDRLKFDVVLIEGVSDENLGMAIMNRFRKAAGHQICQTK
jgi:L-threonylcarbamoyladenylate synthase